MHSEMTKAIIDHSTTSSPNDTALASTVDPFTGGPTPSWDNQDCLFGGVQYSGYDERYRGSLSDSVPFGK